MFQPDQDGVLARVQASSIRRGFACLVLYGLGALLFYVAIARPPSFVWLVFLLALGGAVLAVAEAMRRATRRELILTQQSLSDDQGRVLALMSEVETVDRGAFAMKPSNGFTLVTKTRGARAWQPGLWWRSGRRIGVGGVTASGPAKFMAERIAMLLATRD